jgi:hypothetical protein
MWHKEEQGQVLWCFWKGPSIAHCDPDMAWRSSDCPCSCPTIRFCLPFCVCFSFQGRHPFLSFNFRWMLLRERRPFKSPLETFPAAHVFNWKQVHRDFQTYFSYWARPYSEDSAHWPLTLIKRKRPDQEYQREREWDGVTRGGPGIVLVLRSDKYLSSPNCAKELTATIEDTWHP